MYISEPCSYLVVLVQEVHVFAVEGTVRVDRQFCMIFF